MSTSVYMDPAVGGDGNNYDDTTSATTGLDNGGHRLRFIPLVAAIIGVANYCKTQALAALASANSAVNAPGTSATSITAITPAVASQAFTLAQTGKLFAIGQFVTGYASASNYFGGQITAFNSGTGAITVNILIIGPTPVSASAWTIALTAPIDASLTARMVELERINSRRKLLTKDML